MRDEASVVAQLDGTDGFGRERRLRLVSIMISA
jgi:hypothetical protein